jgi:hypothetical protein
MYDENLFFELIRGLYYFSIFCETNRNLLSNEVRRQQYYSSALNSHVTMSQVLTAHTVIWPWEFLR